MLSWAIVSVPSRNCKTSWIIRGPLSLCLCVHARARSSCRWKRLGSTLRDFLPDLHNLVCVWVPANAEWLSTGRPAKFMYGGRPSASASWYIWYCCNGLWWRTLHLLESAILFMGGINASQLQARADTQLQPTISCVWFTFLPAALLDFVELVCGHALLVYRDTGSSSALLLRILPLLICSVMEHFSCTATDGGWESREGRVGRTAESYWRADSSLRILKTLSSRSSVPSARIVISKRIKAKVMHRGISQFSQFSQEKLPFLWTKSALSDIYRLAIKRSDGVGCDNFKRIVTFFRQCAWTNPLKSSPSPPLCAWLLLHFSNLTIKASALQPRYITLQATGKCKSLADSLERKRKDRSNNLSCPLGEFRAKSYSQPYLLLLDPNEYSCVFGTDGIE